MAYGNLRNEPAFNALVPTTRNVPTLLRRGPYTGRLYQKMLERILNNDRFDVILLDEANKQLFRILHDDWVNKYNRNFSNVLKENGLAVDNKNNLIKLSTPIQTEELPPVVPPVEPIIPEGNNEEPVLEPVESNVETQENAEGTEVNTETPAEEEVNTKNTQEANSAEKNKYHGKNKNR